MPKDSISSKSCNELSMMCYRGFPRACHAFNENKCEKQEVKYTKKVCQKAFNKLLTGSKIDQVKKAYGEPITNCFNKYELERYGN